MMEKQTALREWGFLFLPQRGGILAFVCSFYLMDISLSLFF
jgi:hypothetical protein